MDVILLFDQYILLFDKYIYWSNSKMASILYDYITEYMKNGNSLAWYDVALNTTMNTCILLDKF